MAGCSCSCGSNDKVNLIYACSGVANTGYLADQIARGLMKDGVGNMTCLSAMGADISGFIASARGADKNIVIDGCSVSCGKLIFEKLGIPFQHFITTDFGVEKKKTVITGEVIEEVKNSIKNEICKS